MTCVTKLYTHTLSADGVLNWRASRLGGVFSDTRRALSIHTHTSCSCTWEYTYSTNLLRNDYTM